MFVTWECAISGECIEDTHITENPDAVVFITPKGIVVETYYQGFGQFGGIDAFAWLAEFNKLPKKYATRREDGKHAKDEDIKFPIKIVKKKYYKGQKYDELPASGFCSTHFDHIFN